MKRLLLIAILALNVTKVVSNTFYYHLDTIFSQSHDCPWQEMADVNKEIDTIADNIFRLEVQSPNHVESDVIQHGNYVVQKDSIQLADRLEYLMNQRKSELKEKFNLALKKIALECNAGAIIPVFNISLIFHCGDDVMPAYIRPDVDVTNKLIKILNQK